MDRVVRVFLTAKQRCVALLLAGAARVLLLLRCTGGHCTSCGALPGMCRCPDDLSYPRGSDTAAPGAAPDGVGRSEGHPGRHCRGPPPRDAPWPAAVEATSKGCWYGEEGAMGCVSPSPLCPPWGAPGKWSHVRGAGDAAGHGLGAKHLASFLSPRHPNPELRGGQWQN